MFFLKKPSLVITCQFSGRIFYHFASYIVEDKKVSDVKGLSPLCFGILIDHHVIVCLWIEVRYFIKIMSYNFKVTGRHRKYNFGK